MRVISSLSAALIATATVSVAQDCSYQASNVLTSSNNLTADLTLTGSCSQYPADNQGALLELKLLVEYQTGKIIYCRSTRYAQLTLFRQSPPCQDLRRWLECLSDTRVSVSATEEPEPF
jgi:hypothetical protein